MTGTDLVEKKWTQSEMDLVKTTCAPKCTDDEFKLMMYLSKTYGLDPLAKQIWAIKYQESRPASIFVGRDGLLAFAHRSGQFDGMETSISGTGTERTAKTTVHRKDMKVPFVVEVSMKEYDKKQGNWLTMPDTMLKKVSQAQALRMAFNISGVYVEEEMSQQEKPPMRDITPEDHDGKILIKDPIEGDVWIDDPKKHGKKK
jgi:phage recombination protein Bet